MKTDNTKLWKWIGVCGGAVLGAALLLGAGPVYGQNVIAWGDNTLGKATVPPEATNVVAVAAGKAYSVALRDDGTVVYWGQPVVLPSGPTNVVIIAADAVSIAAGYQCLALRADGSLLTIPNVSASPNAIPPEATNITAIAEGELFSLALRQDGRVIAWGNNGPFAISGVTNVPASVTNVVAIAAGPDSAFALKADGSTVVWGGGNSMYVPSYPWSPPSVLTNVQAASGGGRQNLALLPGGAVQRWPVRWEPAVPAVVSNAVMVASGTNYHLVLNAQGNLSAWAVSPRQGWPATQPFATNPAVNVPVSATNIIAMAAGSSHGLAVRGDSAPPRLIGPWPVAYRAEVAAGDLLPLYVRATGCQPLHYQWLADGAPIAGTDSPFPQLPAALGTDNVGYQVVVSNAFGCVTSAVAKVTVRALNAWGKPRSYYSKVPAGFTNACALAAGAFHCLALNADGSVLAWGKDADGQGDVPASAANVVALAAGGDHSLALRADGSVVGWGRDWDGQADVPAAATNVVAIAAGWAHSLALRADGTVVAWGNDDEGQIDTALLPTNFIAVAAGYFHSLGLRSDGTVVTWGWDVPVPAEATNVVAIAAGWEHCLALRADGTVIAWGDNTYGQSTVPSAATNVIGLAAGYYHNLALRADGSVIAWGKGYFGLTNVPPAPGPFSAIAAGEDYSLALVMTGPPRIVRQPVVPLSAAGEQVVLSAGVAGGFPLAMQWYVDGVALDGATNAFLVLPNIQLAQAGHYQLRVSNGAGSAASAVANLGVTLAPPQLSLATAGSGQLTLGFYAASNTQYVVEYKTRFEDPDWVELKSLTGRGATEVIPDASAAQSSRFYRVRRP